MHGFHTAQLPYEKDNNLIKNIIQKGFKLSPFFYINIRKESVLGTYTLIKNKP